MAGDFTDSISTVPGYAVSISLLPVSHGNDALGITIPGKIINAAIDNTVFALGDTFSDTIPDSHNSGRITAGNVESRRSESSDGGLGLVFGVLAGDCGVVD